MINIENSCIKRSSRSTMKKYQDDLVQKLKKLPVSDLTQTLKYLLEWSRPVLSIEEFQDFERIVHKFSIEDGPELQVELEKFVTQSEGSWLLGFWLEGYLSGRGPVQSKTNFALVINPEYHEKVKKMEVKAGMMIFQLVKIYKSFVEGTYPLEQMKSGQHIDMSFYANFFKSVRLPEKTMDQFYRGETGTENSFILILKNGHYFKFYVTDEKGNLVPLQQLIENIQDILALELEPVQDGQQIHYLSGIEREISYEIYTALMKEQQNQENFKAIADSLFIVSFNDFSDESEKDRIKNMLLHPENQFFTKTMQLLFTKNGSVGFNFEHSAIDGVPTLTILNRVIQELSQEAEVGLIDERTSRKSVNLFSKLEWQISHQLSEKINLAKYAATEELKKFSISHYVFNQFGKESIKQVGISPDAFFHTALAMAQYEVSQSFRSIYEPVAMRAYYQGRTESARSMSMEKRFFVEAFFAKELQLDNMELKELFKKATVAHGQRLAICQSGNGIERHLFGLKQIAEMKSVKNESTDYFFLSEGMNALQSNFISTTGIPFDILESFSFTPVNQKGYGLYYGLLENQIILDISSREETREAAEKLLMALCANLVRLGELAGIESNK